MVPLKTLFISVLSIAVYVTAAPHFRAPVPRRHYAPDRISGNWKRINNTFPTTSIEFTFVLGGDYESLAARMVKIAAEHSPWLTKNELAAYIAPSDEARAAVETAIEELGASKIATSSLGDKITVSATIEKASQVCNLISANGSFIPRSHFVD